MKFSTSAITATRYIGAVSVNLTRQAVKDAPPYDSMAQLNREQEVNIFKHYGHHGYWEDEVKREAAISHH
jgi:hypothetical protein